MRFERSRIQFSKTRNYDGNNNNDKNISIISIKYLKDAMQDQKHVWHLRF